MKRKASGKKIQFIILCLLLFLIVAVFAGYRLYAGNSEQQANVVLERLLSCTLQEAEEFEEIMLSFAAKEAESDEVGMTQRDSDVSKYFAEQFGELMTDSCMEGLVKNRNFYRGAALAKELHSDIKVVGIELTRKTDEEESYIFSAELETSKGELAATVSGTISMSRVGKNWVAKRITMTVK